MPLAREFADETPTTRRRAAGPRPVPGEIDPTFPRAYKRKAGAEARDRKTEPVAPEPRPPNRPPCSRTHAGPDTPVTARPEGTGSREMRSKLLHNLLEGGFANCPRQILSVLSPAADEARAQASRRRNLVERELIHVVQVDRFSAQLFSLKAD